MDWCLFPADSLVAMSPEVIGWVASVVFLCRLLPQPIRLARTGVPDGVSPLATMNAALSDIGWLLYGLSAGLAPVWVVALLALPPGIWTIVLLRQRITRRDVVGASVWLAIILLAWLSGGLVALLGMSVLVNQGPQVWAALRSNDLDGIATTTWYIALVDASLWGGYGVVSGDVALMSYGVVLFASASVILGRVWWTRRLEPVLAPAT